ncbi:MAG: triose-phosphate isomerase [Alphaproteobacteria bacterium]|nr:triose-phosphate isomerase [Alphaproteobacteria bacterium]
MTNRKKLVAGNWKMNGLHADGTAQARELAHRAVAAARPGGGGLDCELLVCPPATLLSAVAAELSHSGVALGGQDCHEAAKGAHTGDISAEMLRDAGCTYVILGHSERRQAHRETDAQIRAKVSAAWRAGLVAILCVGETREEREAGEAVPIVEAQLAGSLPEGADARRLVVAYEPVWAIGTGLVPTFEDIEEIHAALRARVPSGARLLYGGSVNPKNAGEILALADVDGALVGGASLKAEDFWAIARAAVDCVPTR